jgi:hypothetical protein
MSTSFCHRGAPPPGLPRFARNDTLRGNPKLKALNPKQMQKLNIKNQNYNSKSKNLPHF